MHFQNLIEFTWHFFARHLPSLFVCLLCHGFTLSALCSKVSIDLANTNSTEDFNATKSCHVLLGKQ